MRSYETARSLFSFLGFCAWIVVAIGGLVAITGAIGVSQYARGGAALLAVVPGLGVVLAGLLLVAFVQIGRANVDTAEYTQQMLKISRDQLDVSKQSLKQGDTFQKSYANLITETRDVPRGNGYSKETAEFSKTEKHNSEPVKQIEQETQYEGRTIKQEDGAYSLGNLSFPSLASAQTYIDQLGVNPKINAKKPSQKS